MDAQREVHSIKGTLSNQRCSYRQSLEHGKCGSLLVPFTNFRELLDVGQRAGRKRNKDTLGLGCCFCGMVVSKEFVGLQLGYKERSFVKAVALDRPNPKPNADQQAKKTQGREPGLEGEGVVWARAKDRAKRTRRLKPLLPGC